ncbi:MAG TPA: uroporphyrinogen decarboxylase family protein [Phycisphaerae bacterium]|nr:uroporphyrinogen decarboxylase family protein [Phycisphaerae bacterium]
MTSRQRVLAAIEHVQPDRAPVDFGAHRSSGIMAIAYRALRRHLGLPERLPRVYDMIQQLAIIDEDVLARFGVDAIELGRGFCHEDRHWKPWRLPDGGECLIPAWIDVREQGGDWVLHSPSGRPVGIQKAGSLYFEQIHWPYLDGVPADLSGLAAAMSEVSWAAASPPGPGADLAAGARDFRTATDRAIVALFGGNLLEWGQFLCRNDRFLLFLRRDARGAHRLLDALVELHLANLEKFLAAVGPHVDIVLFGDDLGMQTGPQMSPATYHDFFFPRHRLLWQRAKQLGDVKIMLHCCGGVRPLLDDLIAAGLDAINPVQISCAGMEPADLKRDFGGRICLWGGGCDTRHILPHGTPDQVRAHVLEQLATFAPGGGFVFQQVHNIMADVPPHNIVAMFDAVAEFNRQGLAQ